MTTKKLLGLITLASGIVAGSAAYGAGGDIYEIRPCTAEGTARAAYGTVDDPLTSGEDVYFMVRLRKRTATSTAWYVDYKGLGSEEIYKTLFPMQIGIYVSGQLRYATLVGSAPNASNGNFTDLVFHYKTEAGDVAFPAVLAVKGADGNPKPADEEDESLAYYLNPARYGDNNWYITNGDGEECNFFFGENAPFLGAAPDSPRSLDYDLSKSGVYVQTIDFDDEWEVAKGEANELWRSVHEGSTITVGTAPRLEAKAEAARAVTLHVWSDNEDAVRIKGGRKVALVIGYEPDGLTPITKDTWVGDITFAGGETFRDFQIEGVAEGGTANLILSQWDNYRYPPGTGVDKYVTVPVKCIEPLPASVVVESDRLTATADGDYLTAKARLSVYLTQPSEVPVTITVTPSFEDGYTGAWGSYVRFSTTQDNVQTLPSGDNAPTVTIPAGSTEKKSIYVFTLRGDTHTVGDGHQMQFTPSMSAEEEAASGIHDKSLGGMWISAAKPVITTPDSTSEYDVTVGDELEVNVAVSDTYADLTDTDVGYTVQVKTGSTASWTTLPEAFKASGEGGELVGLVSGQAPKIRYPSAGDQTSQIRVTSPVSGKTSEITTYTVHVASKMTANVTANVAVANEGETATFTIGLSANNPDATLYAFVIASDSEGKATAGRFNATGRKFLVTSDMDATALSRTRGIPIGNGRGGPGNEVSGSVKFLDGESIVEGDGLTTFYFDVAICSTEVYDPATVVYEAFGPTIEVLNLPPAVTRLEMNGDKPLADLTFRSNPYVGSEVSFKAIVADPGSYDLSDGFKTRWTVYGPAAVATVTIEGNPNLDANARKITFTKAGTYEIYVEVQDKDMAASGDWIESDHYSVTVDLPHLVVTPSATDLVETDKGAFVTVDIGQPNAADPIVVKLTVEPAAVNPGRFVLDPAYKTEPAGYPALGENEYYIVFRDEAPVDIEVYDLDGTAKSKFNIRGEVVNDSISIDPTRTWAQYYADNSTRTDHATVTVVNADPVPGLNITTPNTNAWKVAGGPATQFPIRWGVKSDVDADFTEPWQDGSGPGIKVTVTGCANEGSFFVTDPGSNGVFIPDFGSEQGERTVTLIIEDKDNGSTEAYQYLYVVEASKFLMTTATGPSGGNTTSALSQKYAIGAGERRGLGEGHIWVPSAKFSGASDFTLTWNCSKQQQMRVYAAGYKTTAPVDNGSLDGGMYENDVPLDQNGNNGTAGNVALANYHTYSDPDGKDSYLYTWLFHTVGEAGGMTSAILGSIAPEKAESRHAYGLVPLADEANEDGAYADTYIEAIFAKEWRPLDNCGDINQDGIPDRSLVKYGLGVYNIDDGTLSGNDLAPLIGFNDDEDYLPGGYEQGNTIVPNVAGSWDGQGGPFHAFFEIRGFGAGLNAGYPNPDGSDPAPDYSTYEQRAYLAWKGLSTEDELIGMSVEDVQALFDANIADATADLKAANESNGANGWSPERPTDPTEADTDQDELPDGYEFWFWYGAKVGYPERTPGGVLVWQGRLVGRRFNLADIEAFDEIPSEEIVAAFDPQVNGGGADELTGAAGSVRKRDFDNDGLTDYEEMLIGTSPVDCDTDGDGLPDGWEVTWNLHPLEALVNGIPEETLNPDGDFMAAATALVYDAAEQAWTEGATVVEFDDADGVHYVYLTSVDAASVDDLGTSFKGNCIGSGAGITLADCLRTLGGEQIPVEIGASETVVVADVQNVTVANETGITLIHDQVYAFFGYDPRTAWGKNRNGYVADRWDPSLNNVDQNLPNFPDAGLAVNTRPYSNKDEFLYGKYTGFPRGGAGLQALAANCTNPNVPFEATTFGDGETQYQSATHGADTDGDAVPDGWEIYVGYDPLNELDAVSDDDGDLVSLAAEYRSNDGASVYGECETVTANTTVDRGWYNKFFPTDPNDADTDGDGLSDNDEGLPWVGTFYAGRSNWIKRFTFIYGTPEDDGWKTCIRGGGMNPNCADTDFDGLPDGWEYQHAGVVVTPDGTVVDGDNDMYTDELKIADGFGTADFSAPGEYIVGGMDATNGADAQTTPMPDPATGTWRDFDFDRDGLENFQEYLVQTVRMWRYDDAETPLMGRAIIWTGDNDSTKISDPVDTGWWVPVDAMDGARYLQLVQNAADNGYGDIWSAINTADNLFAADVAAAGEYDFVSLGYFAPAKGEWDPVALMGYGFMRVPSAMTGYAAETGATRSQATAYVTTDPRQWDTDSDGMDDFWEIFHGINPILGGGDVIADAYLETALISADNNVWCGMQGTFQSIEDPGLDPFLAPWRMGLPEADPDGDGLRNVDESILGNMTTPTTYHTDPTPLWMTDTSSPMSYVAQFYPIIQGPLDLGDLSRLPWTWSVDLRIGISEGRSDDYRFSFEQTEGYDTDGDWRGDNHELVKAVLDRSDPLDANDPSRRAALYLPGSDACAYSYLEGNLPVVDAYDVFRQFTVEMWVKPEKKGAEQTVFERGFAYPASNLQNDEVHWRANFRIAIDKEGVVYGMFDNDNAVETGAGETFSCQTVMGRELPLGKWSHVALTFDGKALRLYIDGDIRTTAATGLIPANGIVSLLQNPSVDSYPQAGYATLPGANTVGARRAVTEFDWTGGFDQFTDFFQGYVSEVRLWDGARSAAEIKDAYKVRMTQDDIASNRDDVFGSWYNGGTRNDGDANPDLPAHLIALWNFAQLPSAVEAADVAKVPSGFQAVLRNCRIGGKDGTTPDEAVVGWWNEAEDLHSTVYDDYHVVPWIKNAVSALPLLDESFQDSMYWSEPFAGYKAASQHGLEGHMIPNGGNPYKGRMYKSEGDYHYLRLTRLAEYDGDAGFRAEQYSFESSRQLVGLDSLVPLGGAFAKRDPEFWDGQGAATVWSDTNSDADGDDLPDWWEDYAKANYGAGADLTPSTTVDYNGTQMTAGEAYVRDLAHGMLPSKSVDVAYVNREDKDFDGLPDWWSNMYGVSTRGDEDEDFDGLSNYTEYLLSEVFDLGKLFSPVDAYSVSDYDTDYFFRIGKLYAGEIFTDHDMMEDSWEADRGVDYVSRYAWDALSDNDEDRWSAFAECRYNSFVSSILGENISHMLGDAEVKDFPVPTLKLTLRYNQSQSLSGSGDSAGQAVTGEGQGDNDEENTLAPIVVKTYTPKSSQALNVVPDATFKVRPGESVDRVFYLGMYGDRIARGTLTPGYLEPGSFELEMAQVAQNNSYTWSFTDGTGQVRYMRGTYANYMYYYNMYGPSRVVLQSEEFQWSQFTDNSAITVSQDGDSPVGFIRFNGTRIGTMDTQSGAFAIDMSKLAGIGLQNPTNGTVYSLTEAVFRIAYKAKVPVMQSNKLQLYLGAANIGAVREGRNRIVAFYDLDDDGDYTPGEPLGFANDVDVGWFQGEAEMELSDTSPIITRAALRLGGEGGSSGGSSASGGDTADATPEAALNLAQSDRALLYGTEDGDFRKLVVGQLSGGKYERFRVMRTLVKFAGQTADDLPWSVAQFGVPNADPVVDKWLELDQRNFFFEGDVLENGALDLDWDSFESEVMGNSSVRAAGDPVEVTYRIVLGNGDATLVGNTTNNLYSIATVRHFDPAAYRTRPATVAPGSQAAAVYGARPVFKWTMGGNNSYTAFRVQIMRSGSVVWDSGVRRAPAADLDGVYTYVPEAYAGDQLDPAQNYTWHVSMYNAKFKSTALWSDSAQFRMNTLTNSYDYGSINVAVRYFGPSEVLSAGNVYVEAFDTPDFSGAPVSRARVTAKSSVSQFDVKHEANAVLVGLPKGTYYVRAFIDNNFSGNALANDRVRDSWESWGYVCPRAGESAYMFSPTAIVIGEEAKPSETFTCYIEDVDTNGNCLPDAWEMVKNNGSLDSGTENIDDTLASGVAINKALTDNLQALQGDGTSSSGLAAYSFAVVKNAGVAALMLEVDTPSTKTYTQAITSSASSSGLEAKSVRFSLVNAGEGSLVVKAEGDAEAVGGGSDSGSAGSRLYSVEGSAGSGLVGQLMTSTDLKTWTKASAAPNGGKVTLTVEGGEFSTGDIDLSAYAGEEKRFFKIVVE